MAFEEVAEVFLSDENVFTMFWKKDQGWKLVEEGCCAFIKENLLDKGLEGLEDIVLESDKTLCRNFVHKIQAGMLGAEEYTSVSENKMGVALHLRAMGDAYYYCGINCHFMKEENGAIYKMVLEIQQLDPEEIYRIQLAQTITNDKNPSFFSNGAKEIMTMHPDWKYALVQFDVAKFKLINEQFGEEFGDEILNYFIHTLKLICNEYQLYTRLTADVFMILTPYETLDDINRFIDRIDKNLLGYKGIAYTLVYGVCVVSDIHNNLRAYGDAAALARQSIKDNALTHVAYYEEKMKENMRIRKFVEDNMEKALQNHEFVMYLQPKYSIGEERMVGAEALVRWIHPERGVIPPMDFVPLFEQNGFVIKMDRYIWEEACKLIRNWIDEGEEPLPVSVNVSRRHLKNMDFVQVLNELIDKYQIPKKYLEIEITETVEEEGIEEGVSMLKENGYTLLMDDFGSGYSSLNMLKDTQFDVIKIDRGFLQDFIGSARGQKIVEHTIRMTKAIGLDLIAEGVETKEQAKFLGECGCDKAQGFYYAKPMSVDEFNRLLFEKQRFM